MHMIDSLVSPTVAGTMYGCSSIAMTYSVRRVRFENDSKKIPIMGVVGSFIFATQMVNFAIPGTGSSGHFDGAILSSVILGPYAGFLTMTGVLCIQCLLFADGGILTLGCNIWNMAFYGCLLAFFLVWRPMTYKKISRLRIILSSMLSCILSLVLGAFSVTLETLFSGTTDLSFNLFLSSMLSIHLVIGIIEGVITASILIFIYKIRPDLFYDNSSILHPKTKGILKKYVYIFLVFSIIIGGVLSLFASSNPDGLEWSVNKIIDKNSNITTRDKLYKNISSVQDKLSMFPDYNFRNSKDKVSTSLSGIIGVFFTFFICSGILYIFKFFKKRK
ncbi:energy-coupling factor ABC transporter permease [Enterococcus faecium]